MVVMTEAFQDRVALSGSYRSTPSEGKSLGPADPNKLIEVSVYLRRPDMDPDALQPHLGKPREQATVQASQEDIALIEGFAQAHNLSVVRVVPEAFQVVLSGTTQAIQNAFKVASLERYDTPSGPRRVRTVHIYIPREWEGHVVAVLGIDDRVQARFHYQYHKPGRLHHKGLFRKPAAVTTQSYSPADIASLYNFPANFDGSGQCIALIELGGGYQQQDLQQYFSSLNLPKQPQVVAVSVDNAQNQPGGDPNGADGEVELDIEIAGACASGARIAVYFAPNTDQGFIDAINQAVHDTTNKPNIISISWGSSEDNWTDQARTAMNQAFYAAGQQGITICCAAGDQGAGDGVGDNNVHVDFPASSPYVLGCGGTRLEGDVQQKTINVESVWNDGPGSATGGGVSDNFAVPAWQQTINPTSIANGNKTGRGVPDVAGNADPQTGYQVLVDGNLTSVGGTSAVAPLWAALIACFNQALSSSIGFINPLLYQNYQQFVQATAFHDIVNGNNDTGDSGGGYSAQQGWDACTGLGTPNGTQLLSVLQQLASTTTTTSTQS
jgi:kumamolisin